MSERHAREIALTEYSFVRALKYHIALYSIGTPLRIVDSTIGELL